MQDIKVKIQVRSLLTPRGQQSKSLYSPRPCPQAGALSVEVVTLDAIVQQSRTDFGRAAEGFAIDRTDPWKSTNCVASEKIARPERLNRERPGGRASIGRRSCKIHGNPVLVGRQISNLGPRLKVKEVITVPVPRNRAPMFEMAPCLAQAPDRQDSLFTLDVCAARQSASICI